ncbi:MAG: BadF/BadG/BcrA/BcrD ATPase family protein [Planctomycetota bacterium]
MTMQVVPPTSSLVMGLDGGGSKTVAVIAFRDELGSCKEIARAESGPSNVLTSDDAKQNIIDAIMRVQTMANDALGFEPRMSSSCFCLAGAGRKAIVQVWRDLIARQSIGGETLITDDAEPVLRQCGPRGASLAVISGTGSIVVGRCTNGGRVRCGGWGPLISDEGSGYDVALNAVRQASLHEDGRLDCPAIHRQVIDFFEGQCFTDIIPKLGSLGRQEIAQLTNQITQLDGDIDHPEARVLLQSAGRQLADLVQAAKSRIEPIEENIPLAMAGGLLCQSLTVRKSMLDELQQRNVMVEAMLVDDPVTGAVMLAADAIG